MHSFWARRTPYKKFEPYVPETRRARSRRRRGKDKCSKSRRRRTGGGSSRSERSRRIRGPKKVRLHAPPPKAYIPLPPVHTRQPPGWRSRAHLLKEAAAKPVRELPTAPTPETVKARAEESKSRARWCQRARTQYPFDVSPYSSSGSEDDLPCITTAYYRNRKTVYGPMHPLMSKAEFKKYVIKTGVWRSLRFALRCLCKEDPRPKNAIQYIVDHIGPKKRPTYKEQMDEILDEVAPMERDLKAYKAKFLDLCKQLNIEPYVPTGEAERDNDAGEGKNKA